LPPQTLPPSQRGAQSPPAQSKSGEESFLSVRSREPRSSQHRFTPQGMQPELISPGVISPSLGTPFTKGRHRRLIRSPVVKKSFTRLEKHPTSNPRPCHSCPFQGGKRSCHICCHRPQGIWCQVCRVRSRDTGLTMG